MHARAGCWMVAATVVLIGTSPAWGQSPWSRIPWQTKKPTATADVLPTKGGLELTDRHGPWLILAASFHGPTAAEQARELADELRNRYRLSSYVHRQRLDVEETVDGLGVNQYGGTKKMRPLKPTDPIAYVVMVGDFESVEDPRLERTLDQIKALKPLTLTADKEALDAQPLSGYRQMQRYVHQRLGLTDKAKRGPMGAAFVTRNPLLPEEYFAPKGLDPLVVEMNSDAEHSLLDCPGKFSVRVATFRGHTTMNLHEMQSSNVTNKLADAAEKAHKLTVELRRLGYEAYEFHDRFESLVTVGAFDWVSQPRADGKEEINPAVLRVMQTFNAESKPLPGASAAGLAPRQVAGVVLDVQPVPVAVPKRSVATEYAREGWRLFR